MIWLFSTPGLYRSADFGVVGTWQEFLPPLIEELRPVLAELAS